MKIVFLDVDGVLNSINNTEYYIDENKVKLLENLVNMTNANVVLHSGWRFWFDDNMIPQTNEAKVLNDVLNNHGIKLIGKTVDYSTEEIKQSKMFSIVKAKEILNWLSENGKVDNYIVLDDMDLNNYEISFHQIKTDRNFGLSEIDVENAISILKEG